MCNFRKILIFFYLLLLIQLTATCAYSLENEAYIECSEKECSSHEIKSFFNTQSLWYPGKKSQSVITIKNTSQEDKLVATTSKQITFNTKKQLSDALNLKISRQSVNKIIWNDNLSRFYKEKNLKLGLLGSSKVDSFLFEITMFNVSNEFQGAKTQFDLLIGFFVEEKIISETPTPIFRLILTPTQAPIEKIEEIFTLDNNNNVINFIAEPTPALNSSSKLSSSASDNDYYYMIPQKDPNFYDQKQSLAGYLSDNESKNSSILGVIDSAGGSILDIVTNFFEQIILLFAKMLE